MNLPVPVYLRPLDQKDASMKVIEEKLNIYSMHNIVLYVFL